jgi:hypothetical protein
LAVLAPHAYGQPPDWLSEATLLGRFVIVDGLKLEAAGWPLALWSQSWSQFFSSATNRQQNASIHP